MAQQLTERQQEIKGLLEEGNPPPEIAKKLKITTNAVYQQIRRMRKGGTSVKSNGSRSGGTRSSGRKSAGSARSSAQTPPRPAPAEQRAMTPLQAIRARRDEITANTREADKAVEDAERALARAKDTQTKVQERHTDELKNLDAAEAAVKGEAPKAAAKPRKRTAAKRSRSRSGGKARSGGSQASSRASSGGNGSGSAPAGSGQQGAPAPAPAPASEGEGQTDGGQSGEGAQQPEPAATA